MVGSSDRVIPSALSFLSTIFAIRRGGSVIDALSTKFSRSAGIVPVSQPFVLYGAEKT